MDSKKEEEVRKRRARARPLNRYQRMVLLGGLFTILLVIGVAQRMAPMLSVGVIGAIGAILLVFFLFKYFKEKKEMGKKVNLREIPLHGAGKAVDPQETLPEAQETVVAKQEMFREEEEKGDDLQGSPLQGKAVELVDVKEKPFQLKGEKNKEELRLQEAEERKNDWKKWGPYLSERQWGTVREDYSESGNAWDYFTHDQARSRAYRWGEDGLGGISDDKQRLCFALALWNGKDPILKERLFGLTNSEGNHGEDVKEYYFYLDSTPTHSYMKYLYKYPQAAYPYADLVETNRRRNRNEMEYELLDTGVFNDDRYFDVFVEYAKGGPEDILVQITATNRGPEAAELHVLPTLWFRNDWASWVARPSEKPMLKQIEGPPGTRAIAATHPILGKYYLYCKGDAPLLFTENETNHARLHLDYPDTGPYLKDGINNYVVHGQQSAVNPEKRGTKVSAHYRVNAGRGQSAVVQLRLTDQVPAGQGTKTKGNAFPFGQGFDETLAARLREADEFYRSVIPPSVSPDAANVMRQGIAGMLWSKQYYYLDADQWLEEHRAHPLHRGSRNFRNREWFHMVNNDIISMPDKWEYPWYAAWDLAFHTLPISIVDPDFAKEQMKLMLRGVYLHPSGQIPAYEWNFSDVNPPVHAWATLFLHRTEQALRGESDLDFLKSAFNKLLLNFTWWVNRKDRFGKNVFEGGLPRPRQHRRLRPQRPAPTGGYLEQADGTAWMALFTQNMPNSPWNLPPTTPSTRTWSFKFVEHFYLYRRGHEPAPGRMACGTRRTASTTTCLRLPDGSATRLKVRSMVGLLPLCATTVIEKWQRSAFRRRWPRFRQRLRQMPELWSRSTLRARGISAWPNGGSLPWSIRSGCAGSCRRCSTRTSSWAPTASARSPSSTSSNPYVFHVQGQEYRVDYLPAESNTGMFGGNSNWRGPIWMPVNALIIRALLNFYLYYGDNFKIECPTGSGKMMNLFEVSKEIANRLTRIFLRNEHRPAACLWWNGEIPDRPPLARLHPVL